MMRGVLLIGLAVVLLVAGWQIAISASGVPAYLVPAPLAVGQAAIAQWRVLLGQTGFTLAAAVLGLVVSTAFATGFAVLFTLSRSAQQAAMPGLLVFRAAPVAAIAPLIMLFAGRGIATSIVVVTIVSFFPLLINLQRGLAGVDRGALEMMHVCNASALQQMRLLRLPAALPFLFTGLRIAGGSAVLGAMLSEWITGSHGLGNLILESADMRETELLWAAVLMAVVIGLGTFGLTAWGEARATRWRRAG